MMDVVTAHAAFGALALPAGGALSVRALAAERALDERRLRWLLRALAAAGVLARAPDRDDERYLVGPGRPPAVTPAGALLAAVIARRRPLALDEVAGNPDAIALGGPALTPPEVAAPEVAEALRPALATGGCLLDAGGGGGAYTDAALAAAPAATAVLCDVPAILAHAARTLAGRRDRVRLIAGDVRRVPLPRCRAVLASNLLHLFDERDARALVLRLASALEPGGRLVIKEVALDEDGGGPLLALRLALSLAVHGQGELHAPSRLETWMRDAGLGGVTRAPLVRAPESIVLVAVAPGGAPSADQSSSSSRRSHSS